MLSEESQKNLKEIVKKINIDLNNVNKEFYFLISNDQLIGLEIKGTYFTYYMPDKYTLYIKDTDKNIFSYTSTHNGEYFEDFCDDFFSHYLNCNDKAKQSSNKDIYFYLISFKNNYNILNARDKFNNYDVFFNDLSKQEHSIFKAPNIRYSITYPEAFFSMLKEDCIKIKGHVEKPIQESMDMFNLYYDFDIKNLYPKKTINKKHKNKR